MSLNDRRAGTEAEARGLRGGVLCGAGPWLAGEVIVLHDVHEDPGAWGPT